MTLPVVQMAFAYYSLESVKNEKPRLHKRLRLLTNEALVANSIREVYNGAEAATSLQLLIHKVHIPSFADFILGASITILELTNGGFGCFFRSFAPRCRKVLRRAD